MDRKIVVSIRLAQATQAAYVVVLRMLDPTIYAVLGALLADLVCIAFRPACVGWRIRERCISGVVFGKLREVFLLEVSSISACSLTLKEPCL